MLSAPAATLTLSPTLIHFILLLISCPLLPFFFFFNDTATTEIYTLSLHDALPIWSSEAAADPHGQGHARRNRVSGDSEVNPRMLLLAWSVALAPALLAGQSQASGRSEEHTSELQSQSNLVCRLLLEKKNKNI